MQNLRALGDRADSQLVCNAWCTNASAATINHAAHRKLTVAILVMGTEPRPAVLWPAPINLRPEASLYTLWLRPHPR